MPTVTFDAAHSARLWGRPHSVIIRDENGQILGRFFPQLTEEQRRRLEPPPLSEDELRRREEEEGYTTSEVLAYLESLDVPSPPDEVGADGIGPDVVLNRSDTPPGDYGPSPRFPVPLGGVQR